MYRTTELEQTLDNGRPSFNGSLGPPGGAMETTLYATYENPSFANQAFVELLKRGASYMDVILVTKRTYIDTDLEAADGRLDVPPAALIESHVLQVSKDNANTKPESDITEKADPFGEKQGSVWLLESVRYPGDLTNCIIQLGFSDQSAREAETAILEGGAMLIVRVPSGTVDDIQGWRAMKDHGGKILTPKSGSPYLG